MQDHQHMHHHDDDRPTGGTVTAADTASAGAGHAGHGGHPHPGHHGPGHHGDESTARHDDDHAVHTHGQHAGHSTAMFKNRFWLTLVLAIPVVYFSPMMADLLGYMPPEFPGSAWIPPVLGTVIFFYGGQPFLKGGLQELKDRRPGMMLLIGMAITVAFVASWITSLAWVVSTWTSGGNSRSWWPSCCWATGSR